MFIAALVCTAFLLAFVHARPVLDAAKTQPAQKTVDQLLNDLKILEQGRKSALENAQKNLKVMADPRAGNLLTVLALVDALMVDYRNYFVAVNTLIHSDERSTAAHEALGTIKNCRQQLHSLLKAIKAKSEELQPLQIPLQSNLNFLQTIFEATLEKNNEVSEKLRIEFYASPFTKYLKDMPDLPDLTDLA